MKNTNIINNISFYSFLVTIFLLPFFFIPGFMFSLGVSKGFLLLIGVSFSLFFWFIACIIEGKVSFPKSLLLLSSLTLSFSICLAAIFSASFDNSFFGQGFEIDTFISILTLSVALFLSSVFFQREKAIQYGLISLFGSFVVVALLQMSDLFFKVISKFPYIFVNVSGGNFVGSFNELAIFSGLIVMISVLLLEFLSSSSKLLRLALVIVGILGLFMMSVANYETVWIVLGIFSLVLVIYKFAYAKAKSAYSNNSNLPIVAVVTFIISLFFIFTPGNYIQSALGVRNLDVRLSVPMTIDIAKQTLATDPIFGVGPNRFTNSWLLFKSPAVNQSVFWNTDFNFGFGLLPTFIITSGILGGLAWLFFLISFILLSIKAFKGIAKNVLTNLFTLITFIASVYYWLFTIIYTTGITIFILAFVFTGMFLALAYLQKGSKVVSFDFIKDPRLSFFSILILVALMCGIAFVGYKSVKKFASIVMLERGIIAVRQYGDFDKGEARLLSAIKLFRADLYYRVLSQIYMAKLDNLISNKDSQPDSSKVQSVLASAQSAASTAIDFDRTNVANWVAVGLIYENLVPLSVPGAFDSVVFNYGEALKLSPKNPQYYLKIAQASYIAGKNDMARDNVGKALQLKGNYVDALVFSAGLEYRLGNFESAKSIIQNAISLDSQNKDALAIKNMIETGLAIPTETKSEN